MTRNFPRVLVLSDEGPQTGTAGGLLLHRLFRLHPPDRLRVLARDVPALGDPLPGAAYRRLTIPWARFEDSRFHRLKRSLRAVGLTPAAPRRQIESLLEGFSPEVVFCVMQHAQYFDTAGQFARARGIPYVVAVHDLNDEFEPVHRWARPAARRRDAAFYRGAAQRLCISPEMEGWCARNYGAPGDVLYPNRDDDLSARPPGESGALRRPGRLTLGFAGNVNYGYGRAIAQVLPVLRETGTRLVLYSRAPGGEASPLGEARDCLEFRGFVPSAEAWAGIKRDCDAVWLPYPNPAGSMEPLYTHHFPSKLPEYLALGMPVLVTGPDYATGVRWARRNAGAALAASGADHREFAGVLGRLATDDAGRLELARKGLEAGRRDFDPVAIREKFYEHLNAAVSGPPTRP